MTYQEFVDYLTVYLWRENDAQLVTSMSNLIKMAEASLNQRLKVQAREEAVTLSVIAQDVALPDDYRSIVSLTSMAPAPALGGEVYFVSAAQLYEQRRNSGAAYVVNEYSISGSTLLLSGPFDAAAPAEYILTYYKNIPSFEETGSSFLIDNYLDLFTFAVLKQAAPYLREDERLKGWQDLYMEALNEALDEDAAQRRVGITAPIKGPSNRRLRVVR